MTTLKEFSVGALTIHMAKSRIAMDRRAAAEIPRKIRACLEKQSDVRMVFAAALSQSECATVLREDEEINWPQINAFHMDEHFGQPADASQRFGLWLHYAIFEDVVHLIPLPLSSSGI
jgi:glucosamine-6-phosphate deaminase